MTRVTAVLALALASSFACSQLTYVFPDQGTIDAGAQTNGVIVLASPAPAGGTLVELSSNSSKIIVH